VLRLVNLEELEGLLLQLPEIVRQQEQRSYEFAQQVRTWLSALETALTSNRSHLAGNVAAIRSALIAAEHGQVPTDLKFRGRATRTRVHSTVASQCLQQAAALATGFVGEHRQRFSEAERVARQLVAAAVARGLVSAVPAERDNTQYLKYIRKALASQGDLEAAAVHVEGLVGPHDLFVLLDRALTRHLQAIE
jgi:hypothetical protein